MWFIPISFTGRASVRNSCSMTTALDDFFDPFLGWLTFEVYVNIKQAKSQ